MPHAVYTRHLGRNRSWRKATARSLAQALLQRERIHTTLARAKEAQRLAERLITLGKKKDLSARRRAARILNDPGLVQRLFSEIAPRFETRPGGYTRILHDGYRAGDGASAAVIELVERAPAEPPAAPAKRPTPKPVEAAPTRKPEEERPKPGAPKEKPLEKLKGFIDGLRRLLRRKDRPSPA